MKINKKKSAFTLLELLIVIGVLAIIATTVALTLNPAELLRQGNDSRRIVELQSINKAIQLAQTDDTSLFLGSSGVVYLSLPDTNPNCSNYSLPSLPTGYSYACQTPSNFRRVDGTGWLPINFTALSMGSPFSALPIDPENDDDDNLYYTYENGYVLTARILSNKYTQEVAQKDGGLDPWRFEIGNGVSILDIPIKFANEQEINIISYTDHAMEPSISRDGQYLFWNSLNDGIDTSIFYAQRVDDTNFQSMGKVGGVNGTPPHLDAVASMDINNNFYWVSTRNYPTVFENYQSGKFNNGVVTDIAPVNGDFYIREPGWIIMDAEISPDGELLFLVNAKFMGGPLPMESDIGVANKVNNEFIKDQNSGTLLQNINTTNYLEYAPSISANGMEIFFTRIIGNASYIYVASRNSLNEPFGNPELLDITGNLPEAPSISLDGKTLYYHKKDGQYYKIYKMIRVP